MQRAMNKAILGSLVLIGAAVALIGCGSDSSGGKFSEFTGVWKYDVSNASATCADGVHNFDLNGAHKLLEEGVAADLIDLSNCDYNYDVAGKVATIVPGQTCDLGGGDIETVTSGTLTLISAMEMEEDSRVTDNFITDPTLGNCAVVVTARLKKIAKD